MRLTIVLLLLSASGALGVAPPGPSSAELVRRLGADDFDERERAAELIDKAGGAALPALRAARRSRDLELRRRANDLAERIERREDILRVLRPTRLRLNCKDVPIEKAVADFARLAGCEIQLTGPGPWKRRVTLDTGETTFWEALALLETAAGLTESNKVKVSVPETVMTSGRRRRIVYLDEGALALARHYDGPLCLTDGKRPSRPSCQFGALRLEATGATVLPDNQISLTLRITPEPHLAWQGLVSLRIDSARDEHGQELRQLGPLFAESVGAEAGERERLIVLDSRRVLPRNLGKRSLSVALQRGPKPSKQLRELRCTLAGWVRTAPEELDGIAPILGARGKTFTGKDGTVFAVRGVSRDSGRCTVRVEVTPPPLVGDLLPAGARLRHVGAGVGQAEALRREDCPWRLLDARGQALPLVLAERERLGGDNTLLYVVTYTEGKGRGGPARLVFTARRSVLINVPFVLTNVPLPPPKE